MARREEQAQKGSSGDAEGISTAPGTLGQPKSLCVIQNAFSAWCRHMARTSIILVVSHDPQLADLRKKLLENAGYEVVTAMNVQAVREACERRAVELAVIGHSLPPAEKRRVWLEVRQLCGGHVPILELRNNEFATVADSTVIVHHPETHSILAERVRRILEE